MDFVFTTTPERVAASMCKPMAWAALDAGHRVVPVHIRRENGRAIAQAEDATQELPANPFAYGHTGLVEAIASGAMEGWRVDWQAKSFDRELWIQELGDLMWNHRARILPLSEALREWKSGHMHLCPSGADSGPKAFTGLRCDRADLGFELAKASRGNSLNPAMRVALSESRLPEREWRCVFVQGEWVAAGQYMDQGRVQCARGAPERVDAFAREVARRWLPGEYCVMDVAQGEHGLGVVEFNSLHSSGLYELDRSRVVASIAEAWAPAAKPRPLGRLR